MATCSRRGCLHQGLISLSELCGTPYKGFDEVLLFCEHHVLDMLFRYRLFKDLEIDLVYLIKHPHLIRWYYLKNKNYQQKERVVACLKDILQYRKEFQNRIVCKKPPFGHAHWVHNIQEAILCCEETLWVFPKHRKRRRNSKHNCDIWTT